MGCELRERGVAGPALTARQCIDSGCSPDGIVIATWRQCVEADYDCVPVQVLHICDDCKHEADTLPDDCSVTPAPPLSWAAF